MPPPRLLLPSCPIHVQHLLQIVPVNIRNRYGRLWSRTREHARNAAREWWTQTLSTHDFLFIGSVFVIVVKECSAGLLSYSSWWEYPQVNSELAVHKAANVIRAQMGEGTSSAVLLLRLLQYNNSEGLLLLDRTVIHFSGWCLPFLSKPSMDWILLELSLRGTGQTMGNTGHGQGVSGFTVKWPRV